MAKGLSSFLDFLFALENITYTWWEINMLME